VARERRIADADQEALHRQLDAKDRELRAAESKAAGSEAKLARVRKARDALAKQRHALTEALTERDMPAARPTSERA
jgi:hypothetical protein